MAQAAQAHAGPKPGQFVQGAAEVKPIPPDRIIGASFSRGETMIVTLPGAMPFEEGEQSVDLWANIGSRLSMGQHVEISNDADSFWAWCRVDMVMGNTGAGVLKKLILKYIVPPQRRDVAHEPAQATGEWHVEYRGPHERWCVVSPTGAIKHQGINTQGEAATMVHRESGNPRPR